MMAVDGMELCGEFKPQVLMIVTADPDFGHLALTLRKKGVRVELAAIEQNVSSDLKGSVNHVIDLRPLFNKFENLRNEGSGSGPSNGTAPGTLPSGRYIPDVEDELEDLGPADHQGYS